MSKFIEIVTTNGRDVLINLDHVSDVIRMYDSYGNPTDNAYVTLDAQNDACFIANFSEVVNKIMEATK